MLGTLLEGKKILAVDDEPDILEILDEELAEYGVVLDTATTYEEACNKLDSYVYDIAILDIMGVRGFELLEKAVGRGIQVVMLTAHGLSIESLKRSIELGARAYLPKDQLPNVPGFLEDVIELGYSETWHKTLEKLRGFFGKQFGDEWKESEKDLVEKFKRDGALQKGAIIE